MKEQTKSLREYVMIFRDRKISSGGVDVKILETHLMGKSQNHHVCEDLITVSSDFVAVFDGVSSKSGIRYDGKTTGYIAVELMSTALKCVPPTANAAECFRSINRSVYSWYEREGLLEDVKNNPRNRPAASAAIYSRTYNQVWVLGDSQVFFNSKRYTFPLKIDEFYVDMRMKAIEYLKAIGKTTEELLQDDTSAAVLRPLFEMQPYLQNSKSRNEYSYSILDGFEFCETDIHVLQIPSGTKEVSLATDGYPMIFGSLKESEDYLERVIQDDPLCCDIFKHIKGVYIGQDSFDDRAYVRFSID